MWSCVVVLCRPSTVVVSLRGLQAGCGSDHLGGLDPLGGFRTPAWFRPPGWTRPPGGLTLNWTVSLCSPPPLSSPPPLRSPPPLQRTSRRHEGAFITVRPFVFTDLLNTWNNVLNAKKDSWSPASAERERTWRLTSTFLEMWVEPAQNQRHDRVLLRTREMIGFCWEPERW